MNTRRIFIVFASLVTLLAACQQSPSTERAGARVEQEQLWLEYGQELANATFSVLSTELRSAIGRGGVPEAISYCSVSALALTDSVAMGRNAVIRRTTLKPRNPANGPDSREAAVLDRYRQLAENGQPLKPQVDRDGETVHFYAPIVVQELCLKCHGIPGETILEADYALISSMYPDDKAIGYKAGDWRGMWSISFNAESL